MLMLLKVTFLALVFSITHAYAQESWLCTEDSSQIQGSRILACGVGENAQEAVARRAAFDSAVQEFSEVCGPQTPCGKHKYNVMPSRSTCEQEKGIWKCYRLIVYSIAEDLRDQKREVKYIAEEDPYKKILNQAMKDHEVFMNRLKTDYPEYN